MSVLRVNRISFSTSAELGYTGVEDYIWIPEVASHGLVIVTADTRMRLVPWEKEAILSTGARIVCINT